MKEASSGTGAPGGATALLLGTTADDVVLQQRVARFCLITLLFSLGFFVADHAVSRAGLTHGDQGHLVGCGLLIVGWLAAARKRPMDRRALVALDALMVTVTCVAWASMAYGLQTAQEVSDATLATAFTVLARAVVVPSRPLHTLVVAFIASLPVPIVAVWFGKAGIDAPALAISRSALWAIMTTVGATVVSVVIYGLRQRVREARQLGQYVLERKIGSGGMGEVYKARHLMLRRPTAIKLIDNARASHAQLRRFEQEVQLTSRLSHANTICIYDYGRTPDGVFYYAMEYLDGLTLRELVEVHGPLCAERVIHLMRQACAALVEAHGIGLIHRDVKPENIMVCERGGQMDVVKVLDFGLVKQVKGDYASLTDTDVLMGTPHFMAPEAIKSSDAVDARSDLYGLGCVAYFLLTGSHVFDADNLVDVCSGHLHIEPTPPSERGPNAVPGDLEGIVMRCLAKQPNERPATAEELGHALEGCADTHGWTEADARTWWAETTAMTTLRDSGERTRTLSRRTVAVDMTLRDA